MTNSSVASESKEKPLLDLLTLSAATQKTKELVQQAYQISELPFKILKYYVLDLYFFA